MQDGRYKSWQEVPRFPPTTCENALGFLPCNMTGILIHIDAVRVLVVKGASPRSTKQQWQVPRSHQVPPPLYSACTIMRHHRRVETNTTSTCHALPAPGQLYTFELAQATNRDTIRDYKTTYPPYISQFPLATAIGVGFPQTSFRPAHHHLLWYDATTRRSAHPVRSARTAAAAFLLATIPFWPVYEHF